MYQNQSRALAFAHKWRRYLITAGILLILWLVFLVARDLLFFRVSKTDPNLNNVAAASAYIDIYFSKDIVASSVSLKYSQPFVHKTEIGDNKIRLDLQTEGLEPDQSYTITIVRVDSADGKQLRDKKLTFKAKDIAVNKLSASQLKALLDKQDHYPYEVQYVTFDGFDQLLDRGVSAEQLQTLKDDIFNYSKQVKQEYWTVKMDPSSVVFQLHNAESADLTDRLSSKVILNGETYTLNAALDPIDNIASAQLLNAGGVVVYDSFGGHD
jgi:hypothetical protein